MNNILDTFVAGWLLVVAPGLTDYDVETLAEVDSEYSTLYECQLMSKEYARGYYHDDHAWCEPVSKYETT